MWWLVLPALLIAFLVFILFSRIEINVNTEQGFAGIRFGRIAEASLLLNETVQAAQVRIAWWKREFDLSKPFPAKREVKRKPPPRSPVKKVQVGKLLRKMKGVLQSFRVNECTVSIDTGDMPLNGILFPWFYLLRLRTGKNISINFTGDTVIILQAENSIARMLWAFIKS